MKGGTHAKNGCNFYANQNLSHMQQSSHEFITLARRLVQTPSYFTVKLGKNLISAERFRHSLETFRGLISLELKNV